MSNIHAALEIGTTRTVLAVGELEPGGRVKVLCHAAIPSTGVRKSQILDLPQVTQSIRSVLHEIENVQKSSSRLTIGNAFLAVSGQHVLAQPFSGTVAVGGERITNDELTAVQRAAHEMALPKDRELLDIVDQDYVVDKRGLIFNPKDMSGRVLALNTLQIHCSANCVHDARTAADAAHLEIREPVFAVTCAADAVLEDFEKKNGVLVIDFGGGSTGYAAYIDGYLVTTGVIGVGGDHVTNDIANAFQTTNAQAEGLKITAASAVPEPIAPENSRVKVEQGDNPLMDNRTVSRAALNSVVNARLLELVSIIRDSLEDQDVLHRLNSGVVITGGGAKMRNLDQLVTQALGTSVRYGRPINVDGFEDETFPAEYATIAGTLLYAHRNYEEKSIINDIFGRFFK